MEKIDRKFKILAVNPVNGKVYDESNSLLLCAKDAAVPAALYAYLKECRRIGANPEHVESVQLLIDRVHRFQEAIECKTPDSLRKEIPRQLHGEGV